MDPSDIIKQLKTNLETFRSMLEGCPSGLITYRPDPAQWCLLEVICHLCDEEVLDFRTRCLQTLQDPQVKWPPIDPQGWVIAKNYINQDFNAKKEEFYNERVRSVELLHSLKDPDWNNIYHHPKIGPVKASMMLHNWLMHDYLHMRQINRIKTEYFRHVSGENLQYAGNW